MTRTVASCTILACLISHNHCPAVELSMVPVQASGAHTLVGDNGIHMNAGGQFVVFEIYISNWDPDGNGEPSIRTAQAATNGGSYGGPSSPDDMTFYNPVCTTDADCTAAYGVPGAPCRNASSLFPATCAGAKCCEAAFVDRSHPEFACAGISCTSAAEQSSLRFGFSTDPGEELMDDGMPKYMGSLVLQVPPQMVAGVTLTFRTFESFDVPGGAPPGPGQSIYITPGQTKPGRAFVSVLPVVDYDLKSRYLVYHLPYQFPSNGTSISVELVSLHHPTRPAGGPYQPADFSGLEGQTRWLGPPAAYRMSDTDLNHLFYASQLQCEPWVGDWSDVSTVHIYGAEIVPDSIYAIEGELYHTGRWADVAVPFEADVPGSQPDLADVSIMLDRFRNVFGTASKAQTQLQPSVPNPTMKVNFSDIALVVDAFRGFAYPFPVPPPCP